MQVVPDDVLIGFRDLWDASVLGDLVPGKLWHGRPETLAAEPWATIKITEGDKEEFSDTRYLQKFDVEINVWSSSASPIVGTIKRALMQLYDRTQSLAVPNAESVVEVKPMPGKLEQEKDQRNANDVLVAAARWRVLIEAIRETIP